MAAAEPSPTSGTSIEAQLASMAEAVRRLEARVARLESGTAAPAAAESGAKHAAEAPPALPSAARILALLGRTCLILGGATFIRALTDAGTLRQGWGITAGVGYAFSWAFLAIRAKTSMDAGFHLLASILITYPMIVESTARFGFMGPGTAAALLLAATCLHGTVAWHRNLHPAIWTALLASLASGFILMSARQAIEPFLSVFFFLGLASLWLTYGRRWHGLRWPTALAADLGTLILVSLAAWPGGPPEAYRGLPPVRAMAFSLALAVLYTGSFALRMLQRRRVVNAFEAVQTALALLVGFGGALRIAAATGSGTAFLGLGAALAGAGCYAAAIPFAADQEETRANFRFFTFLALVFLLMGSLILLPAAASSAVSGGLGLAAMLGGLRLRRPVLVLQSGIFLAASAIASGLAAWSFHAFLAPGGPSPHPWPSGPICLALLTAALALFLWFRPPDPIAARSRMVVLPLAAFMAAAYGSWAVAGIQGLLAPAAQDAGLLAAIRTAVLSSLAIGLAWSGRRLPFLDLRWLVYPLLAATALKFLFEDVAAGRPSTLFPGFMCYGAALMLAPRLLKVPAPPEGGGKTDLSKQEVDP